MVKTGDLLKGAYVQGTSDRHVEHPSVICVGGAGKATQLDPIERPINLKVDRPFGGNGGEERWQSHPQGVDLQFREYSTSLHPGGEHSRPHYTLDLRSLAQVQSGKIGLCAL